MPNNDINLNLKTTGAQQTQSVIGGVASSLKKLAVAYIGYRTATGAVKFFAGSVKEFVQQKQATEQLSIAIGKSAQVYADWAQTLQGVTTLTDDQILSMMRLASTFGVAESKLQKTVKASIGLARAMGIDATTALRLLTRAETGSFMMLQRYLPALKQYTTDREKLAFIMRKSVSGWEMEKRAAADSPWELMKKSIGELKETIGGGLYNSVVKTATALNEMLKSDNAQAFARAIGKSIGVITGIAKLGDLGDMLGRLRYGAAAELEKRRGAMMAQVEKQRELVSGLLKQERAGEGYGTGLRARLDKESAKLARMESAVQQIGKPSQDLFATIPEKMQSISNEIGTWWTKSKPQFEAVATAFASLASVVVKAAAWFNEQFASKTITVDVNKAIADVRRPRSMEQDLKSGPVPDRAPLMQKYANAMSQQAGATEKTIGVVDRAVDLLESVVLRLTGLEERVTETESQLQAN
jgi:hypothetical protein